MLLVVISILAWISFVDLRTHRIPNRDVAILAIASIVAIKLEIYSLRDHLRISAIVLMILIALSFFCGLGMGDVKLVGVLTMFVLAPEAATYMTFLAVVAITASIHAIILSRGKLRKSLQIPLAPAIFCGTMMALFAK
jgi:Flp pilus assembly protein protease CpaA